MRPPRSRTEVRDHLWGELRVVRKSLGSLQG